ncbi:alpha/beta fold hydrolase [Hydrogenophaga pseudoflava]|uniref:alpha/beta fold hydrolase n=1 Tax=Hydrogenophaga pseudoflava TaxID=47421 RepID=UPI000825EC3C|nr:alpha/beta fold hydrolase [Hydrogenophaga pseudoflava]
MLNTLSLGAHRLSSGTELPALDVAYATFGQLAPDGRNAVLVTHGYTSGPSMLVPGHHVAESSWAPLLGPGRPLDTDRFFIVCSNMLGSSFGTTGPNTTNPATGRPWGPDFPAITLEDIVAVQHRLLQQLGVRHLRAVVGPSYGGWQALQWALSFPDMVDAVGSLVSGLTHPKGLSAEATRQRFADHPAWNGGWHYGDARMTDMLTELRRQTLRSYGLETLFEARMPDPAQRQAAMDKACRQWAERFDPNSMVTLAAAAERFDVRERVGEIRARLLFMVCTTDAIFPPDPAVRTLLGAVPGPLRYRELDSPYGHMASGVEWQRLEEDLRWLLDPA